MHQYGRSFAARLHFHQPVNHCSSVIRPQRWMINSHIPPHSPSLSLPRPWTDVQRVSVCLTTAITSEMKRTRPIKTRPPYGLRLLGRLHIEEERMTLIFHNICTLLSPHVSLCPRCDCLSCGFICIQRQGCVHIYILITACPSHRPNQFLSCFILPRALTY